MSFAPRRALKDVNAKAIAKTTEKLPAASKSLKRPVAKSPVTDAKLKKRKIAITDENDNPEAIIEPKSSTTTMVIPEALKSAAHKLVDLAKVLSSKDTEWVTRNESLNALRTLASENQNPTFWKLLTKHMKKPLSVQLTELRSQVIKEICGTVTYLAMMMRKDFEQLAKYLLPFLAKLVIVAIKVISESAHDCVQAILKHVQSDLCVQFVTAQALTNKSALFRARSGEYYFQILDEWSTETVKANLHSIEQGVMKLLTDSDGAARKNARSAFASLARNFRGRAVKLYRTLDKHVVKLLKEEYSAVVAELSGAVTPAEEEEELAQHQQEDTQQEEEVLEEEEQDGGGRECAQDSYAFAMMPSEESEETTLLPAEVTVSAYELDSQVITQTNMDDKTNDMSNNNISGVTQDGNSTCISTPNRKSVPVVDVMNSVEKMLCAETMNPHQSLFDSPLDLTRDEPYQFEFPESKSMPKMDFNDDCLQSMETVEMKDAAVSQPTCEPCAVSVPVHVDTEFIAVESTGCAQEPVEVVHTISGPCLCCLEKDEMIASLQDQLSKMANTVKYFGMMESISKYTIADLESRLQKE